MKRICSFLVIVVMGVLIFAGNGNALSIPNPNPGTWGDDDGTELWYPDTVVISAEMYDLFGQVNLAGFAFYFESDPFNPIVIFGPEDQDPVKGTEKAQIDFNLGIVTDLDDGGIQSTFVNSNDPIGFMLRYDHDLDGTTAAKSLYTEAYLNGALGDVAATFPNLLYPTGYFIGFEGPIDAPGGPPSAILSFHIVSGVTPIPEPSSLLLLGSGLISLTLAGFGIKRLKRDSVS